MTLAGAERAVVDVEKLRDYCLSAAHPRGRHKARVFASALGLFREDAEWLKAKLLNAALRGDVTKAEEDDYGCQVCAGLRVREKRYKCHHP